jgi:hypothetical protein
MINKYNLITFLDQPIAQAIIKAMVFICFLLLANHALADGKDILQNTDADLIQTLNGSGRKYLYLVEGFISLATYIKTKNLVVLFGIIIVAVFFNIIMKMYGA